MNESVKHFSYLSLLVALAVVVNLVENIFIPPLQFGIHIGLANVFGLIGLVWFGKKSLLTINIIRWLVASFLRGSFLSISFWVAGSGIMLSTLLLIILFSERYSFLFLSMIAAIAHTMGQLLVIILIYHQANIVVLFPLLLLSSLITGYCTGRVAQEALRRLLKEEL